MKHGVLVRAGLLALAFALLGGCLWLAGTMPLRDDGGVSVDKVSLPGGGGTLYLPENTGSVIFSLTDDGEAEHGHWEVTSTSPAVLILCRGLDGSQSLALELARRNVAVLLAGPEVSPLEAWGWLEEQSFVSRGYMGLIASRARAAEALELAETLSDAGREYAAVMVLGDEAVMGSAASAHCRNLMVLLKNEPSRETALAFFGSEKGAERGFSGYYGEGTARSAPVLGWSASAFSRRSVMARVIDWQGSCLGHASGLADDDLICGQLLFCRAGAWTCFVLAAGAPLCRRKLQVN